MPEYNFLEYVTETMTVPFYSVPEGQPLNSIADKWDMKPTHFLRPMTNVWPREKRNPRKGFVGPVVQDEPFKGLWGMIWSGHLRQGRHRNEAAPGLIRSASSDQPKSRADT